LGIIAAVLSTTLCRLKLKARADAVT